MTSAPGSPDPGRAPAPASEPAGPAGPVRRKSIAERAMRDPRYVEATPEQARVYLQRTRRSRRRALTSSLVAVTLLVLLTGLVPVGMWVDSRTVPAGAETTDATVVGYDVRPRAFRSGARRSTRLVQVTPAVDGLDTVLLDYRWQWPDEGDTFEVYPEDGRLRTTSEAGTLHLVGGLAMTAFWIWATVGWVRHRRRRIDERIVHWEGVAAGRS